MDIGTDHYRIVILDKTNFDEVFMKPDSARREIRSLSRQEKSGRSPLHRAAAYPLQHTAETAAVSQLLRDQLLRNCNDWQGKILMESARLRSAPIAYGI